MNQDKVREEFDRWYVANCESSSNTLNTRRQIEKAYHQGRQSMRDDSVKVFNACATEAFNRGDQTSQQIFEWVEEAIKELP